MELEVTIDRRFRGPPGSGNGGYSAGVVAGRIEGVVESTLRAPPPLDTPMQLETDSVSSRLTVDGRLVGEARASTLDLEVPEAPSLDEARAAVDGFVFRDDHPIASCFVCGTDRSPGDGLAIYPGPVADTGIVAAPWVPDASLGDPGEPLDPLFVWSALDCPSYYGLGTQPWALLGRLTASIDTLPAIGDELITIGWALGRDGRKHYAASALLRPDGEVHARASAVWVELSNS